MLRCGPGVEGAKGEAGEDADEDPFYRQERLKAEAKRLKAKESKKRALDTGCGTWGCA